METRRWLNQSQPQTLVIAVFLLYFRAAFAVLFVLSWGVLSLDALARLAGAAAGYGIANERKWGYYLGIVCAVFPFGWRLVNGFSLLGRDPLTLLFEIALVALLLHPQSRDYQRIWFKR